MDSNGFSGGGIYFNSIEGSIILNKVCGYQCYGYAHGQLLYHYTKSTNKNQLFYLSINKCAPNTLTTRHSSFWLYKGIQEISNINSSFNEVYHHSSLVVRDHYSFLMKYSNFYKNYVSHSSSLYLYSGNIFIQYNNFIGNNSPNQWGIFFSTAIEVNLTDCIFSENLNFLFWVDSGKINLFNSFIDHNINIYNSNYFEYNVLKQKTLTFPLIFFSTFNCKSVLKLNDLIISTSIKKIIFKFLKIIFLNLIFS